MKIIDLYKQKKSPVFSIEVLPPRNGESIEIIDRVVESFKPYDIGYYSVTWGAGGSLRGGTLPISLRIKEKYGIETMAHFTCRDFSVQQVENTLVDAKYLGIQNILALRGDPPEGDKRYKPKADGYQYASELVSHIDALRKGRYLKRTNERQSEDDKYKEGEPFDFCVCIACHPEGHAESPTMEEYLRHLKHKAAQGADFALSQMFFDPQVFEDFVAQCRRTGITLPIVPGIFLLPSWKSVPYITGNFNTSLPADLRAELEKNQDNQDAFQDICVEHTVSMVRRLLKSAPGVHFYSMNNAKLITRVLDRL